MTGPPFTARSFDAWANLAHVAGFWSRAEGRADRSHWRGHHTKWNSSHTVGTGLCQGANTTPCCCVTPEREGVPTAARATQRAARHNPAYAHPLEQTRQARSGIARGIAQVSLPAPPALADPTHTRAVGRAALHSARGGAVGMPSVPRRSTSGPLGILNRSAARDAPGPNAAIRGGCEGP